MMRRCGHLVSSSHWIAVERQNLVVLSTRSIFINRTLMMARAVSARHDLSMFQYQRQARCWMSSAILGGNGIMSQIGKDDLPSSVNQQSRSAMTRIWDKEAVVDLFDQYAKERDGIPSLNWHDIRDLLRGIGETPEDANIAKLFEVADHDGNGVIDLDEFLVHADTFLRDNPARMILIVGGPGRYQSLRQNI